LCGLGISENDAKWCASELDTGHVLVTVFATNGQYAKSILARHGAIDRHTRETAIPGHALPATPY